MRDGSFTLTAALNRSPLDARRGVVRLHPSVLHALGLEPWSPLALRGARTTAALAAFAPEGSDRGVIHLDDLALENAAARVGDPIIVSRAPVRPASSIRVTAEEGLPAVDPGTLRLALLGKVVGRGDRVSLLPQDFAGRASDDELQDALRTLVEALGRGWQRVVMRVEATEPPGLVSVTMESAVAISGAASTASSTTPLAGQRERPPTPDELPGLERQIDSLRELLDLGFNNRALLERLGSAPHMGVLVAGPPGSGKGALVEAATGLVGARLLRLWAPALARIDPNAAAARLDGAFAEAEASAPAVLLIEDVDAVAGREETGPIGSLLLERATAGVALGRIAVVCTTSRQGSVMPELLEAGVLDHRIVIDLPRREERRRILEVRARRLPLAPDVDLADVASRTPGFVAADLMALCREAALRAAQRLATQSPGRTPGTVSSADFDAALEVVRPSSMSGDALDLSSVRLDDVGDMEATKKELEEAVIWPLRYPDTFARLGVKPPSGVLLYGPPGCGKTFLVKALAHAAEANFMSVKGPELLSKWVGESERGVRDLFERARGAAPVLVFFDEIDALVPRRGSASDSSTTDRVVAQLLVELDGIEERGDVFVVGATNRPDLVDPAVVRAGRLERLVYVPPPNAAARSLILAAAARKIPLADDVDLGGIAAACDGYSAADLDALAREAALAAMRENLQAPRVDNEHFAAARSRVRPSLDPAQVEALEGFAAGL